MIQLAMELPDRLRPEPRYPLSTQKQLWLILEALRRHEKLTVALALERYGCYALSQRVGELRNLDWPIRSRMIALPSGKHVSEYWLD